MSIDQFNDDPPPVDDGGNAVIEIQKQSITTIQEITELRASAQESNEEELHRRNASAGTERLSEKVRRTRLLSRSTDGKGPVASVQDGAERSLRVQSKDSMFGMMWKKQNKYGSGIAAIGQTYTIPPSDATFMYVKTKHTKPKIVVTFDKAELRKKVDRITFNEARRLLESVYETIVAELFEEGAACWAHHFEQIFLKEKELFNEKAVRYTLNTERPFLYEIIDRIKKSHEAALKENGTKVSFKYLYDLMVFVEPYGNMFDWFITDLYEVIARMCKDAENLDTGAYEVIARIYFKYAVYRDVNMRDTSGAIKWTEKALELAKGELWTAEIGIWGVTLHELIAPTYAEMLIQKADEIMFQDYDLALSLSRKAILAVCEVDKDKFKVHFCRAQMFTAKLLIENDEYQNAKQLLQQMKDKILNADTLELKKMSTEFYYREGTCIMHLSSMPEEKALQIFEKGLKTSRLYGQKDFEALILLNLGKLYAKTFKKSEGAPICYREALTIFFELGDIENIKRTKYLLAEISSNFIFPHLMDLLKTSGEKYCNYYKLRMWKNQCRPFWLMTQEDLMDKVDPIYCLLKRNA